jgi:sulfite exporter TauE/SafE/copper chaperone CopZ
MKSHLFHVHGMHCASCVLLTETEVSEHPKVTSVKSNLEKRCMEVCGDFGDMPLETIAEELSGLLTKHGYKLSLEPERTQIRWGEFWIAVPVALAFALGFVLLQRLGIVNLVGGGSVTYGTAFVVGLIASLSTCMAVVGGLVLSMSATFAKGGDKIRPQVLFHLGRLVSFFVLGGAIGALGSAFQLGQYGTFALSLLIGLVMLVLGLNLLDVAPWTKKLQPSMPRFLSSLALSLAQINHTLTPLLVGIATFFLPCGFTQSMQVYALTTGSFLKGALTMLVFALGTLPVLTLVSFSSLSIKGPKAGIFFKSAGLIVILFALFNIINSLVVVGIIPPIFNL